MLRIAHIADVHWRGLTRHDEYREVFEALAEDMRSQHVDHVMVVGDIFHTKTIGISPEYIEQMTWWLKLLAAAAEVHLVLGNHDGNLVNLSRQDAITPIVNALQQPNIHLYKDSGVFQFAPGYNWCIFSLFDEAGWKDVKPVKGDVNIACYHGPISGAKTASGWEIEDGLPVEFFSEFDFAFLGDIHRLQYLGHRDIELVVKEEDLGKYPKAKVLKQVT